jgi:hypothetical protein
VNFIEQEDPDVWAAIQAEQTRQAEGLEMIASENFTSPAVMQAVGSVLTNKYAEGYPGHRYYGGCEFVDKVEDLARDRLKSLFGAEHVNVQPHSGSQANAAVYMTAIQTGDTVLAFDLAHPELDAGFSNGRQFDGPVDSDILVGLAQHQPVIVHVAVEFDAIEIDFIVQTSLCPAGGLPTLRSPSVCRYEPQ